MLDHYFREMYEEIERFSMRIGINTDCVIIANNCSEKRELFSLFCSKVSVLFCLAESFLFMKNEAVSCRFRNGGRREMNIPVEKSVSYAMIVVLPSEQLFGGRFCHHGFCFI